MANNLAVIRPTKEYLLPSCSSCDSASDKIVFIMQSLNMAARACKTANNFKTSSDPICNDSIARVIHPKVKLYI